MLLHYLENFLLQDDIERCIDDQARTRELRALEVKDLLKLRENIIVEVRRLVLQGGRAFEKVGTLPLLVGGLGLDLRDRSLRDHRLEHAVEAGKRGLRVGEGVVERGVARQSGQHRGLGESKPGSSAASQPDLAQ